MPSAYAALAVEVVGRELEQDEKAGEAPRRAEARVAFLWAHYVDRPSEAGAHATHVRARNATRSGRRRPGTGIPPPGRNHPRRRGERLPGGASDRRRARGRAGPQPARREPPQG